MREKKYFPIFIDISEMKIVVIGGGAIATRRVNTLLAFAEKIVVVAPEITADLQELHYRGQFVWIQEEYNPAQVQDADMVLAATNRPAVNHQVKVDCENFQAQTGRHILVNVADNKTLCDFYFPGIVQKEEMVIGISSGGESPGRVKCVRREIENLFEKSIQK